MERTGVERSKIKYSGRNGQVKKKDSKYKEVKNEKQMLC